MAEDTTTEEDEMEEDEMDDDELVDDGREDDCDARSSSEQLYEEIDQTCHHACKMLRTHTAISN